MVMPATAARPSPLRLACLAEPRWGLGFIGLLLLIFVQYTSLPLMYPVLAPLHTARVAVAIALFGYLIAFHARTGIAKEARVIDAALLLLMFSILASAILNSGRTEVWDGVLYVANWVIIYFLVSRLLSSRWRLQWLLFVFLLLNLKLAQFAVRVYINGVRAGYSGMEIIQLGGASGARTTAFFGNADDFGMAMCIVFGLTWPLLFRKGQKLYQRFFLAVCFVGFLLAVLLSGTRGAVVGAVAVALVALVRSPKRSGTFLLLFLFATSLLFVLPGASRTRFQNALQWRQDQDVYSRLMLWKAGLYMWAGHPAFGVGATEFPQVFASNPTYTSWSPYGSGVTAAHSIYIQSLAELGTAGTLLLLLAVIAFFRGNARVRQRALAQNPEGRRSFDYCVAAGLDMAMVAYLVCGAFLAQLYYPHLWILLGLGAAANRVCAAKPFEKPSVPWQTLQTKRPATVAP